MASILSGASNITISGGTFAINQNHSSVTVHTSAFDKLSATAAHSALHDAPARTDGSRCYPHTRTNDLDHLERWAQGICDEGASVFWLHGGAGVGRSAIMQSLAELCATQGLTLGSFFFSRSDPTRNTAEVLIPTLAYQLAQLFPSAHDVLEPVMNYDPLIFKKSLQVQLLSLFVRPLQHLVQLGAISNNPQSPRVFLIDGLDECGDATQQQAIIQAVAAVCHEHSIPVKFIIASRPETSISTSFRWYKRANHVLGAISLSEDPNAKTDIRRFVKAELHEIHTLHPFHQMIPSDWPHFYDINRLVQKSSSHFIYASTAMKYIWSAKENPVRSLQVVLGLEISRTISPFPELDGLYHHILGSAAHRDAVFQILAHCLFARLPPSVGAVCMTLKCSPDDFFIYMADMTSLVDFPHDQAVLDLSQMVTLLHASLRDFLFDRPRSGLLYIDRAVYLASQLENCLQLLSSESRQKCNWLDWVGYVEDGADRYPELNEQVLETIMVCGHLATTQQVLQQYSLLGFNQCTLDYRNAHWPGDYYIYNRFDDLIKVLVAANSIKTPDGVQLFKSFLDDFFDILEAYICEERKPLAPAILPLMLLGYPAQGVRDIHYYHSGDTQSYQLITARSHIESENPVTALDIIASTNLASMCHSVTIDPQTLAAAAEVILGCLINEVKLHWPSTYSVHKAWLGRTKPGKRIAIGAPRLAYVLHARFLELLRLVEDDTQALTNPQRHFRLISSFRSLCVAVGPKYSLWLHILGRGWQAKHKMVDNLLQALFWMLPKAGFSEKIVFYSKRMFSRNMYLRNPGLVRRVRRCLDQYTARVQNAKLEELGQRIVDGDVTSLIEKSRIHLDAQD